MRQRCHPVFLNRNLNYLINRRKAPKTIPYKYQTSNLNIEPDLKEITITFDLIKLNTFCLNEIKKSNISNVLVEIYGIKCSTLTDDELESGLNEPNIINKELLTHCQIQIDQNINFIDSEKSTIKFALNLNDFRFTHFYFKFIFSNLNYSFNGYNHSNKRKLNESFESYNKKIKTESFLNNSMVYTPKTDTNSEQSLNFEYYLLAKLDDLNVNKSNFSLAAKYQFELKCLNQDILNEHIDELKADNHKILRKSNSISTSVQKLKKENDPIETLINQYFETIESIDKNMVKFDLVINSLKIKSPVKITRSSVNTINNANNLDNERKNALKSVINQLRDNKTQRNSISSIKKNTLFQKPVKKSDEMINGSSSKVTYQFNLSNNPNLSDFVINNSKSNKSSHQNNTNNGNYNTNNNLSNKLKTTKSNFLCPFCYMNCFNLNCLSLHLTNSHFRFVVRNYSTNLFDYDLLNGNSNGNGNGNHNSNGSCDKYLFDIWYDEIYDGSYCGNPLDLHFNSHVGYSKSRSKVSKRLPVTYVIINK